MSIEYLSKLPSPGEVKRQYPLDESSAAQKKIFDEQLSGIFDGSLDRFVLIIGPCSADSEAPVMAYVEKLARIREQVQDLIRIVPRVYTNKPRTTGEGYKGMLYSPDPTNRPNLGKGVVAIRRLHLNIIKTFGFGTADEILYPDHVRYLNDLLSYAAVGARSVENQQHRLVASGISVPVGMKNPTGGDLSVMMNAIYAAQHAHIFSERDWEVRSSGNPHAHAILRGYVDRFGKALPN